MKIGIVGLGKLGLPVAVSIGQRFQVKGYDINPKLMRLRPYEHKEAGLFGGSDFQYYFDRADLQFLSLQETVKGSDIIFVAVQTPHDPAFEGVTPLSGERSDFDYSHLESAVKAIADHVKQDQIVVVISTVLPGTMRRVVMPHLHGKCQFVYNPFFIAMGTVMQDFGHPEFVLLGGDNKKALDKVAMFYASYYGRDKTFVMSLESAELTKVAYNTFISTKIAFANTLMEICHKVPGCDVDDVVGALCLGHKRILSPAYLSGGMGDGGGCHPRDNIAMSWLANKLELSSNMFDDIMMARESQTAWLASLLDGYPNHKKVLLGKSFKPQTAITTGSPAILCANLLKSRGVEFVHYDPYVDCEDVFFPEGPLAVLITTKHQCFRDYIFPEGSVVIDPHRYIPSQHGVKVIHVGVGEKP